MAKKNIKVKTEDVSKKLELNKNDGLKILKGAGIALGGALLTYATDIIPLIEWGEYKPIVVAVSGIVINAGWKYLQGKK